MTNEVQAQPKQTLAQIAAKQAAQARESNQPVEEFWKTRGCAPPSSQNDR